MEPIKTREYVNNANFIKVNSLFKALGQTWQLDLTKLLNTTTKKVEFVKITHDELFE